MHYSLINLEETLDQDLDAILGELCALENNFSDGDHCDETSRGDNSSKASSTISTSTVVQVVRPSTTTQPIDSPTFCKTSDNLGSLDPNSQNCKGQSLPITNSSSTHSYLPMSTTLQSANGQKTKYIPSEPEYITAECVRQKKLANATSNAAQLNGNKLTNVTILPYLYLYHNINYSILSKKAH